MLSNIHNYFGVDSILISNGSSFQIPGIRDYSIKKKYFIFLQCPASS